MFELYLLFFCILAANTYFVYNSAFRTGYVSGLLEADDLREKIEKALIDAEQEVDK